MKEVIQDEFVRGYFDLGLYRLMSRNRNRTGFVMLSLWFLSIVGAIGSWWWMVKVSGFLFIAISFVGAVDHIIIGMSFRRILRRLKSKGIEISMKSLLHYCRDILPS